MSGTTSNPTLISQGGPLNRLRVSVLVASFPTLNLTSEYLGKSFVKWNYTENFVTQIPTGTGIVNSPEPYVMANATFGIIRTQPVASAWDAQVNATAVLGLVTIVPDTSAFPNRVLNNASITGFDITAFDGKDAVIAVTVTGIYYPNQNMWQLT